MTFRILSGSVTALEHHCSLTRVPLTRHPQHPPLLQPHPDHLHLDRQPAVGTGPGAAVLPRRACISKSAVHVQTLRAARLVPGPDDDFDLYRGEEPATRWYIRPPARHSPTSTRENGVLGRQDPGLKLITRRVQSPDEILVQVHVQMHTC